MYTSLAKSKKHIFITVLVTITALVAVVNTVNAEVSPDVYIWNGITSYGNTYGATGNPGGAHAYSATTDNIYYQETYEIEWGITDYLHQLSWSRTYNYYKNATPQAFTSWFGGLDYVTTKHTFKSSTNTSMVTYTSANGRDSKATCWNGNANATTCPR